MEKGSAEYRFTSAIRNLALERLEAEGAHDFPLLARPTGLHTISFFGALREFAPTKRLDIARLVLRRWYIGIADCLDKPLNPDEERLWRDFAAKRQRWVVSSAASRFLAGPREGSSREGKRLVAASRDVLVQTLGNLTPGRRDAVRSQYELLVPRGVIRSFVEANPAAHGDDLACWHDIVVDGRQLKRFLSVNSIFGIASMTGWRLAMDRPLEEFLSLLTQTAKDTLDIIVRAMQVAHGEV